MVHGMDGGVYRIINDSNNKANLKPNTEYKMQFRIQGYNGAPFTESNVLTFTTLNNPSLSISSRTETSMTLAWNAYGTIDQLQFSKDGGTNWTTQTNPNASSGTYQFTGLTANTSNNYKIKCRYKSGYSTTYPVYTQATASAFSTLDYPKASAGANFTIGNSVSVTLNNPLNRSVDVYLMESGVTLNDNRNNYIAKKANVSGTTVSGFNAADDITRMLNSLPSANSKKYDIVVCYPINTKTNMKKLTTNYTYSVNTSTQKPTFVNTNFDYTDINSTTTNLTKNNKCLIKGYSNVRVDISTKATPSTGTTIASYKSTIGTKTASVAEASGTVSMTLNAIDSKTIQVSAIDARTNSTSASKDAEYVDYVPVKFTSATATRKSNGVSELVTLTFRGEYFKESFGSAVTAVTNTIKTMSYKYRKSDSQTWINGTTTITWTTNNGIVTGSIDINGDLEAAGFTLTDSFYIQLTMTDELSSVVKEDILITSGTPAIAISGSNVAIGKQYDTSKEERLQVSGKVRCENGATNKDTGIECYRSDTDIGMMVGIGAGGTNHGIYSRKLDKWMMYGDNTDVYLNGKANTAATADNATKWAGTTYDMSTANDTDTWIPVLNNGKFQHTTKQKWTSKTHSNYNNNQNQLATISCLTYWNGAYNSSNSSNLTYAHQGTIQCKPTQLYNNTNGTSGTITLSQTSANFNYIKIFYKSNDHHILMVEVYSPNGKTANLIACTPAGSTNNYLKSTYVSISGTSITWHTPHLENSLSAGNVGAGSGTYFSILRVEGIK